MKIKRKKRSGKYSELAGYTALTVGGVGLTASYGSIGLPAVAGGVVGTARSVNRIISGRKIKKRRKRK